MPSIKGIAIAVGVPLLVVLLNEHGFLEALGGKTKSQAAIEHPPKK